MNFADDSIVSILLSKEKESIKYPLLSSTAYRFKFTFLMT